MSFGYTKIASSVVFPLHEYLKKHNSVSIRKDMERSQWWSAERLQELQLKKLRELLSFAQQHVPYYSELFSRIGFVPGELSDLSELVRLPLLTKADIRTNTDKLKSDLAQNLSRFNTGGSSGEPLIFFIGKERVSHDVAAKWRATRWWGVDIGDPEVVVWGSPIELSAQDRIRAVRDKLLRTELLPAFEMSDSKLNGFVERIRVKRPRMLFGYPSALSHIALHAEKMGVSMDDLGIKVAFCTSERLYDHQRDVIGRVFGCKVANGYGARDAGFVAHECPAGSMHITVEDMIVEIVDRDGQPVAKGHAGEIVVTHLATRDFPFVRYRTGDVAVIDDSPCSCGRGLPRLKEIQGRSTDFVLAEDGTVMHGLALIYILRDLPQVAAFKIVQETIDHTRVYVVPRADFSRVENTTKIQSGLRERLGAGVSVDVEIVDVIPPEKSGKHRYVVSHVTGK